MFIPISKTNVDWKEFLKILPFRTIQQFDKDRINFDSLDTFIKTLRTISGSKDLDMVFCHVHYSFGFQMSLEEIFELMQFVDGNVLSQWDDGNEVGILTANLKSWRNFIVCCSKSNHRYQKLANTLYAYFKTEQLSTMFDNMRRVDNPDTTFELVTL